MCSVIRRVTLLTKCPCFSAFAHRFVLFGSFSQVHKASFSFKYADGKDGIACPSGPQLSYSEKTYLHLNYSPRPLNLL